MTLRVLEFNDAGIRVSDETGVLHNSPGYALVTPQRIEFGESARGQSRLNPLNCLNQYWHRLSLDPFARPVAHYRHNADIAFSHLQEVARTAQLSGDVLLAVPGSFSRQQLAILLGLIKQCPFRAVGLVDAGLAAVIDQTHARTVIHAELQLHQVVLSRLERRDGELVRESVVQVPGTGWVNMSESLLQLITSAFIQQCRFNPQHNAQSEQMLLDGLPGWLLEEGSESENPDVLSSDDGEDNRRSLLISIRHNNTVHQARVPRSSLLARLQPFFQKIRQQLALLDPEGSAVLAVSERLHALPGFVAEFMTESRHGTPVTLAEHTVGAACLRYRDVLAGSSDAVNFITRLRPAATPVPEPRTAAADDLPTHALLNHSARSLERGGLLVRSTDAANSQASLLLLRRERRVPEGAMLLGEIRVTQAQLLLIDAASELRVNGLAVGKVHPLMLGDRVGSIETAETLQLIRVQDGD